MERKDKRILWIWLQGCCGAGSNMPELLLDAFGNDIERLYNAGDGDYLALSFIKPALRNKLNNKSLENARAIETYCRNEGVGILTVESELYPKRLARISGRPIVLYYQGVLTDLDREVCIAEVGTRSMTEYGARTAYSMAYDMARAGAVVVSGLAKGVDGMAHRGALDAGGYTVAVIGSGIDRIYPPEHADLMADIIKNGAVMTEFAPGTPPLGRNFPIRNRIVSGLSLGTLVVEAPKKSGALITAEVALKQGRDVFAVPGKIGEYNSTGANSLIREGAKMVTSASDILAEYQSVYSEKIDLNKITGRHTMPFEMKMTQAAVERKYFSDEAAERRASGQGEDTPVKAPRRPAKKASSPKEQSENKNTDQKPPFVMPDNMNGLKARVLKMISENGEIPSDVIAHRLGAPITDVLVELTMLEIEGYIIGNPGGTYILNA